MPGIASDRASGINTAPIALVGADNPTPPALGDFMAAFRSGFLTVDDVNKRTRANISETDALKTQLQSGDLQRRLAPKAFENAQAAQELQGQQTAAATELLPGATEVSQLQQDLQRRIGDINNRKLHPDKNIRQAALDEELEVQYQQAYGNLPESFESSGEEGKTTAIERGTPEYYSALRKGLNESRDLADLKAARLKAVPDLLKAQAEAPGKQAVIQDKAQSDVLAEVHNSDSLKRFGRQFEAFQKIDSIKNSGRVPKNSDDIALLYEFVKLLDPDSAVREGEAKLAQSTVPAVVSMYNQARGLWADSNKILSTGARESMYSTLSDLRSGAEKTIIPEIQRIARMAKDRKVPLNQVFTGPYSDLALETLTASPASAATPGTSAAPATPGGATPSAGTRRVVQGGTTFVWDGKNYVPEGP